MSPLIVRTPINVDELKCLYTLWIYEIIAGGNKTKTAEILGLCRITVGDYVRRGSEMRGKILSHTEMADCLRAGVEFLRVSRPVYVTNQIAKCPSCSYEWHGDITIDSCPNGCKSMLERSTEKVIGYYA